MQEKGQLPGGLRRAEVEAGAYDCRSSLVFANSPTAD